MTQYALDLIRKSEERKIEKANRELDVFRPGYKSESGLINLIKDNCSKQEYGELGERKTTEKSGKSIGSCEQSVSDYTDEELREFNFKSTLKLG